MKFIPSAVTKVAARQVLLAQKNSPGLLFGAGVAGMVGSTVLACRATLKAGEVLDRAKHDLEISDKIETPDYTEGEKKKVKVYILGRAAGELGLLYAPAVAVGTLGLVCLTKSHHILNERNAGLAAAYAAVDKAFTRYRERVVDKYGQQEDDYFRYGAEEVRIKDADGHTVTALKIPDEEPSMYARFFDQLSPQWCKEAEYNLVFLRCQQQWANDMLKTRGHIFLNEVYDMLGIPRTKAGQVVGWVISKNGDNYIDFGIYESNVFVNGREGAILLDFNVDGIIYDKIDGLEQRVRWQS